MKTTKKDENERNALEMQTKKWPSIQGRAKKNKRKKIEKYDDRAHLAFGTHSGQATCKRTYGEPEQRPATGRQNVPECRRVRQGARSDGRHRSNQSHSGRRRRAGQSLAHETSTLRSVASETRQYNGAAEVYGKIGL